jgi:amino acid permease
MSIYLAALVFVKTLNGSCQTDNVRAFHFFRLDNLAKIFQSFPIFTFCFCGHMSIFSIAAELENATAKRLSIVIFIATTSATLIFSIMAWSALACFGDDTPQDLLSNYPSGHSIAVARVGMAIVCCGFFPLLVQPVRSVCLGWIESAMMSWAGYQPAVLEREEPLLCENDGGANLARSYSKTNDHMMDLCYKVITILIGCLCLAIALTTSSLGLISSLSGATGCALICNICPPWLYLAVTTPKNRTLSRRAAWAMLAYGIITMPVCITANCMAQQ